MRHKGSLAKGLLIAVAFVLIPVAAVSAQKITPGSTCKVLNQKVVYQNKTYTCIKSGKKLVWSAGISMTKPKPSPSPSSEALWVDPLEGKPCSKDGEKIPNRVFELVCVPYNVSNPGSSNSGLFWAQNYPPKGCGPIKTPIPTPTPSSSPVPIIFSPW